MSISSTMTPTDMAQPIASLATYNTDSASSMGTAGQNMDALAAKLYEDVNKGLSLCTRQKF